MQPSGNPSQADTLTQAFNNFREQLPSKVLEELKSYMISGQTGKLNLQGVLDEVMKVDKLRQGRYARGPLKAFLSSTNRMTKVLDVLVQTNPEVTSLIWGSMRVILQVSSDLTCQNVVTPNHALDNLGKLELP